MMREHLALVDVVIELLDARAAASSRNPDIDALALGKPRLAALNKADLAEEAVTQAWVLFLKQRAVQAVATDALSGRGLGELAGLAAELSRGEQARQKKRGRLFKPLRAMVVGIPNVGKSTFINSLTGRGAAVTGDRPGVTRGRQWIKLKEGLELLDTPGILWPNLKTGANPLHLAFTGAVADRLLDPVTLGLGLLETVTALRPACIQQRYKIETDAGPPEALLSRIGQARGFLKKGGQVDLERTAVTLLDEFRGGKLGRISLEAPP
jgi:ribosome biogenesis GTPase A